MTSSIRCALGLGLCLAALLAGPMASAGWAQAPDPALVEARRQRSNPSFNLLTFRHLDELFHTRAVAPGGNTWRLEPSDRTLQDDAPVTIGGQASTFAAALQELRINGVVVLRDGRLVREIHRNGGTEESRYMGFSLSK